MGLEHQSCKLVILVRFQVDATAPIIQVARIQPSTLGIMVRLHVGAVLLIMFCAYISVVEYCSYKSAILVRFQVGALLSL